jgi:dipeptidyl aminopeptidase/acylaminoacyl peptidase
MHTSLRLPRAGTTLLASIAWLVGRRVCLAIVAVAALAAVTPSLAHAAFPGRNGKIVFQTNRDGNAEIYTANADGTSRINVTMNPAEDLQPRWSPDGLEIVFVSNRTGHDEIYTMNADGSGVTQLTFTVATNRRPSWTADGQILFHTNRDGNREIYRMYADGHGQQNLTRSSADDLFAAASPRGERIVFTSDRGGDYHLYVREGERAGQIRQITSAGGVSDFEANWSPRGNDLVFVRFDSSGGSELFTVHANGAGLTALTNTSDRIEFEPAWSPDGNKIVFHACSGLDTDNQHCANYVMNADGTGGETEASLRPEAPYADNFTGDWIDPFWWTQYLVGSGPSFAQANGRLEISVPADTTLDPNVGFAATGLMSQCLLSGNWDMQVDYQLLAWPSDNRVLQNLQAGNFVNGQWVDANGIFVFNPGDNTGISTNFPEPADAFVPNQPLTGSLRLTRNGSAITAYYLNNGMWTPMLTGSYTADTSDAVLYIFTNAAPWSHPDVKVAFDNFLIDGGQITCPTWWDDSAPDWQTLAK